MCILALAFAHTVQSDSSSTDDAISTDGSGVGWFSVECPTPEPSVLNASSVLDKSGCWSKYAWLSNELAH